MEKNVLKTVALVRVGVVVVLGVLLAARHTVVELDEYYYSRYND